MKYFCIVAVQMCVQLCSVTNGAFLLKQWNLRMHSGCLEFASDKTRPLNKYGSVKCLTARTPY